MFRYYIIITLLFVLLLTACRRQVNPALMGGGESTESDAARQSEESFNRTLEVLQSMEDNPDLDGLPGFERMVQELDRMNKWIARAKVDPKWIYAPFIERLTAISLDACTNVELVDSTLTRLQGDDELDVVAECKKLSSAIDNAAAAMKLFDKTSRMSMLVQFVEPLDAIRSRIASLDSQQNVSAGAARAFVRQMSAERGTVSQIVEALRICTSMLQIDKMNFQRGDMDYLKQCVWTRSISTWARGEKHGVVDRAKALYDWTARNVDLRPFVVNIEQRQIPTPFQLPYQTLLLGSGTSRDRAWLFIELLRQQRIDGCLLGVRMKDDDDTSMLFWGIGVLDENEVYVFLLEEFIPFAGDEPPRIGEDNVLEFPTVATLSQIIAKPEILDRAIANRANSVLTGEQLKRTIAVLPLSPQNISMRMKLVEKELVGAQTMVLYTPLREQEERFGKAGGVAAVELWDYPLQALLQTRLLPDFVASQMMPLRAACMRSGEYLGDFALWRGRILYFHGQRSGAEGAADFFQLAMTPDRVIQERVTQYPPELRLVAEQSMQVTNVLAAYWLGVSAVQDAKWESAQQFLEEKTKTFGKVPWQNGIDYNLGRVYESQGKYDKAAEMYRRSGNVLRAGLVTK
ncbi:MAG: tetratricopeptide repeat protein [Planctomycetaceae bacterium]|nr:tetratricopeptide repeat protein [Planctomycetaceae bacterium]